MAATQSTLLLHTHPQPRPPPAQPHSTTESALASVVSLLDAPTASRAQPLASEFLEYLALMDYNQYYDAMPTATVSVFGTALGAVEGCRGLAW
jgi:hypothetical protein